MLFQLPGLAAARTSVVAACGEGASADAFACMVALVDTALAFAYSAAIVQQFDMSATRSISSSHRDRSCETEP